ncbi:rod shape-determining protein RodA [Aurantibacillus circumpalustris]|uniref:rod shape-determining protein RodA n=1 Tax=Aurantibacillus circumpalustris TaxID=3036359 RepID=UPI00295B1122|nr:rod shape-determining protein RodA [Aurantibacillus circumpalustris]
MARNENNIFYGVDRLTVVTYVLLVMMGWLNIYAAVFDEDHQSIFDTGEKYGKQLIWIAGAAVIAFSILLIDANFYTAFAYFFYGFLILANILVVFFGREIKGSRSWFGIGGFGVQPAEFMKFAANLALAKFLSNQNIVVNMQFRLRLKDLIKNYKNTFIALLIIIAPLIIIKKLQDETGLAIVFIAFVIVLYREGLSVGFLIFGLLATILFVVALVVTQLTGLLITLAVITYSTLLFIKRTKRNIIFVSLIYLLAAGVVLGTNYVYNHLEPHQKVRIDVLLGRGNVDLKKEGYNVNQAKIAIGSGGLMGKGYLKGTQTKYDFVPEQDTDFIFCTVGEEWGFVGSVIVIFLELFLILRIIFLAERQRSDYSRIYGYGVSAVLFFHLAINIGMTIGLMPVIGIPLPFFSYGGSSLWSFTILLFIFIKLDSNRLLILR